MKGKICAIRHIWANDGDKLADKIYVEMLTFQTNGFYVDVQYSHTPNNYTALLIAREVQDD